MGQVPYTEATRAHPLLTQEKTNMLDITSIALGPGSRSPRRQARRGMEKEGGGEPTKRNVFLHERRDRRYLYIVSGVLLAG